MVRPLVLFGVGAVGFAGGCGGDDVDVMVTRVGDRPVEVIREVRAANGIGLQEAKLLLTGVPMRLQGSDPLRVVEGFS
jgi:ribosomal protein L7/L12